MLDPEDRLPRRLDELCRAWGSTFDSLAKDIDDDRRLFDQELADADSEAAHAVALAELADVRQRAERSISTLGGLTGRVEELQAEWRAARRYAKDVLERRATELADRIAEDPVLGAREWLTEVFDALEALEWNAVEVLAGDERAWPRPLDEGAQRIRTAVERWVVGDHAAGLELIGRLGENELDGWDDVLTLELRSRAHRLAAWVSLRRLKQADLAEQHIDTAVELWPYAGRMHAERAAYYLSIGDLDRAATDAQRSVELAKDDAAGYLEFGIWAELSGDFEDADEFYRKALALLPTFDIARLGRRATLIDPPGRLLTRAAETLWHAYRPRQALMVADQALQADLRGPELHPQVAAHVLRSQALEQLEDHSVQEAASAAVEAGRLSAWNGDVRQAIAQFERAEKLDSADRDLGWLLADARLTTSLPPGATKTDQRMVRHAFETWEKWTEKVGPPSGEMSWAYLTRAMIADLGTQEPSADRLAGVWEALLYVEKAIVHDEVDAQRWGYAAQYLRYVHLDELAFEAADRGYKLGSGDRQVLAERLAQLASRGRLVEAEQVAEELVTMFGNDPGVSAARAWLAIHSPRESRYYEGLGLLELPLAGGNDPSWYYEMRALCHVGLHEIDAARDDFRGLLTHALPVDGTTKCRLEVAAAATNDVDLAAHWSSEASKDPTSRAITCLTADAFAAFARDDLDAAAELLSRATEHAISGVELRDIEMMMLLRIPLLTDDPEQAAAYERVVSEVAEGPARERERALERSPLSPDQELKDALARYADAPDVPQVIHDALLAVKARRDVHAGRLLEASAAYQELLSSSFEPEATLGLTRALGGLAAQQAAAGDVEQVRQITERMTALGNVSPAEVATTLASALERSGDRSGARKQLETGLAMATDPRELARLHQRAGGLALAEDDLDDASAHFQAVLATSLEDEAYGRAGQVQIRMALIAILRSDLAAAVDHLLAAARAWKDGGAVDPTAALIAELHGLKRLPGGRWEAAASEALRLVELAVTPDAAKKDVGSELEPLQRELGVL
jgi:tetratricopeptide (TPR) repeat protein